MKPEDKELLLKDLCARLPHGVKVSYWYVVKSGAVRRTGELISIDNRNPALAIIKYDLYHFSTDAIASVKPYLRPMSSLVGKELEECRATCRNRPVGGSVLDYPTSKTFDYLNEHHFDWRLDENGKSMIELGFAIEAPEGMYKTE